MKAALYTRVSTERQSEEGFSMEAQHDILMNLIDKKELQLYKVYSDPGISGGTSKRPGYQLMLADMKAKKFDTVLIHKLDRLTRNLGDLFQFISLINKLDVRLIIAAQGDEEIDTRSAMGKAFLLFSGIWAQIYLDNLREETLKGLVKKAQKGGRHMSRPPLGYEFNAERELIIVENEANIVREIFQLYLKGWGLTKIAKYMNEKGLTGKEGGLWETGSIRHIISNPTYAGFNHFKPSHWDVENRIIMEGSHEGIISNSDFEKAKGYAKRRSQGYMSNRSYDYPYSGIIRCGKCGGNFAGNAVKKKDKIYRSYRCVNNYLKGNCDMTSISENKLNDLVFKQVKFIGDDIQEQKKKNDYHIDLQKEVEKSNRRRKNWMMALGDEHISASDYSALIEEEDERMKKIYEEIESSDPSTSELDVEEVKQMIEYLNQNWNYLEVETQKQFIQNMFRKITIIKIGNTWEIQNILTV